MAKKIAIGIILLAFWLLAAIVFNFLAFMLTEWLHLGTAPYFVAGILFYAIFQFLTKQRQK